jgi:hypothetical protein
MLEKIESAIKNAQCSDAGNTRHIKHRTKKKQQQNKSHTHTHTHTPKTKNMSHTEHTKNPRVNTCDWEE